MTFRQLIIATFVLLPGLPLGAQEEDAVRTLKTRSISFQVDGKIPPLYAHSVAAEKDSPGIPVQVKTYLNHETESFPMNGKRLIFTTSGERASMGKPDMVMAKAEVPDGLHSAVFMFLPGSGRKDAPKYRVLPIDDTLEYFPRGSFKVINLSPLPLRITLEKAVFDIQAGTAKVIKDPPVNERNASAVRAYTKPDGQWRRIGATSWPHPGEKRVIHVAFLNPASGKVELRGIRDIAIGGAVE